MKQIRNQKDFYITPDAAIDVLLQNYSLKTGWILEPCAGNGSICRAIIERSNWSGSMFAVEIRPEEYSNLCETGCDEVLIKDFLNFELSDLKYAPPCLPGTIITNPPFSIAEQIIEKCFSIAGDYSEVIMLLRLGFLESKKRAEFWSLHKDVSLITLKERPSFTGNGTDFTAYAWFVWNSDRQFIIPCA